MIESIEWVKLISACAAVVLFLHIITGGDSDR